METRANYIAVGFFTLVALIAAFAVVFWFGRFSDNEDLVPLEVRIQGSVSGLAKGSLVQFNGIDVGRVDSLRLDPTDPRFVIVVTNVHETTPVRSDTRATIGIRGLSGGAFIQLEGGTPTAAKLLESDGGKTPQLMGDPAALADLLDRVNSIANRTERIMASMERVVENSENSINKTVKNIETFSNALSENSDGLEKFMGSAGEIAKSLDGLSGKLSGAISRAEAILQSVDPAKVGNTIANVESFSNTLAEQRTEIANIVKSVNTTVAQLAAVSQSMNTTLTKVNGVVDGVSGEQVSKIVNELESTAKRANELVIAIDSKTVQQTLDDLSHTASNARQIVAAVDKSAINSLIKDLNAASKNVTTLVAALDAGKINTAVDDISGAAKGAKTVIDDVAKVTSSFGSREEEINQIITNASELTSQLNRTSKKIDEAASRVNALLGSGAGDGLVSDARETLATFRQAAQSLNRQIATIGQGINKFTDRGLRDTQTLINNASQSLNRIDRVIRNLERNPSSIITGSGGSRIRETGAQRPRR
jgi:phospholipid/cholesterol/gamma-HCH transport system substrate-binding protein